MAVETIKEFLVALGYKLDVTSEKKFEKSISDVTKKVEKLGVAMVATALSIEAGVARMADQMAELYYLSQRTGATVTNIQKLQYGAKQIGLTADEAAGALLGLARAIRMQPGVESLIQHLHVETRNANGSMRDTSDILHDLIGRFRQMPFYIAARFAEQLGIDSDTLFMLEKNFDKTNRATADYAKRLKDAGIDADELAKKSVEFTNALDRLESEWGILIERVEKDWLPLATAVINDAEQLVAWFVKLDRATDGWAGKIASVVAALGTLKVAMRVLRPVLRLLGGGAATEAAGGAAAGAAATGAGAVAGAASRGVLGRILGLGTGVGAFLSTLLYSGPTNVGEDQVLRDYLKKRGMPIGLRQNNPGNLRRWGDVPRENGYALFPTAAAGLSAMVGNLQSYGRHHVDTLRGIANRWAPRGDHNDPAAYIASLMRQTGFAPDEHLNLSDPNVLRKLVPAIVTQEQGRNPFSSSDINAAIASRVGPHAVINQKTDIHISGADAKTTAKLVHDDQTRVNSDLLRNTVGALR